MFIILKAYSLLVTLPLGAVYAQGQGGLGLRYDG